MKKLILIAVVLASVSSFAGAADALCTEGLSYSDGNSDAQTWFNAINAKSEYTPGRYIGGEANYTEPDTYSKTLGGQYDLQCVLQDYPDNRQWDRYRCSIGSVFRGPNGSNFLNERTIPGQYSNIKVADNLTDTVIDDPAGILRDTILKINGGQSAVYVASNMIEGFHEIISCDVTRTCTCRYR